MGWWERVTRWEERHRFGIDATLTATTGVLVVPLSALSAEVTSSFAVGVLWSVLLWAPLAWRRRNPVASVVAVYSAGLLHLVLGTPTILVADVAVLVALYSVTANGPRWAHRTAIVSAFFGTGLLTVLSVGTAGRAGLVLLWMFASTVAVATWAFALTRRSRREMVEALRDRAERLEVERDQQARIATAAERTRIAREMHDIVAHSLSVIIAQADGGRYAASADPDAATRALGTVAETGRAALADMRRLLGVLRDPAGGDPAATTPYTPQPAEQDLEQLVETVRSSGARASLVRMGTARPLPPGIGLTVYRICQEALTNVLKHAGPDPTVTVLVQWRATSLTLEVADDGRGAAADSDGAGHGLVGMRERAAVAGGTVTAGPRPGGGFRVRAELPLPPSPSAAPVLPGGPALPGLPGVAGRAGTTGA